MYLVINNCVTAVKVSNFSGHYLRDRSTLDMGVLGYIGIVQHKEHSPEVLSIPPGTPCIHIVFVCLDNKLYKMHGTYSKKLPHSLQVRFFAKRHTLRLQIRHGLLYAGD